MQMCDLDAVIFTPEEKREELEEVLEGVRRQVKRYKLAKRKGTLKKVDFAGIHMLFNH